MKNKFKRLFVGMLVVGSIITIGVCASNGSVIKELFYNNIRIVLDGREVVPTDAKGTYVEPFTIDGTTYLPVRAISNALGLDVEWDASTNTVQLTSGVTAKANADNLYEDLKNWVVKNGTTHGDYTSFSKPADSYGGYKDDNFNLYYWGDTKTVEICLHSVIDDEYSVAYYIYIPEKFTGKYEYCTSYYYRESGEPVMETEGYIDSGSFTKNYPLDSTYYYGDKTLQNDFMEIARIGTCNALDCFKEFLVKEKTGYTLNSIGFKNF